MLRIAITGRPGVGKSTVVARVIKELELSIGGILCTQLLKDGKRVGFSIRDIRTGKAGILSHIRCSGPAVGRYHVNLDDLDRIGSKAILDALGCQLVVIDEIGPMELKSVQFISAVEAVLDSDRPVLVVLHRSSQHPLARRIRDTFEVFSVDEQNRDDLPDIVIDLLR